jgi:O-antigen/teichoic acid export membrane protein
VTAARSRLVKGLAALVSGTAGAQAVTLLSTPILVRLYGMERWGEFGAFSALYLTALTVAAMRFDQAVPVAKSDEEARAVLALGQLAAAGLALAVFACSLAFGPWLAEVTKVGALRDQPWLLPLALLGGGLYVAFSSWHLRRGTFRVVAATTFTQSLAMAAVQFAGWFVAPVRAFALPLGLAAGRSAGFLNLWRGYLRDVSGGTGRSSLRQAWRGYSRFAFLGVPSSLANAAGLQAPTVLLSALFGTWAAGQFYTSMRILGLPMVFLGAAVSQVYLAEFGRLLRENPAGLHRFFRGAVRRLLMVAPLLALMGGTAPWWFPIVFGAEAGKAGVWSLWLTPSLCLGLVCSPVSSTANSLGRQDLQLGMDLLRLALTVACFAIPGRAWSADARVALYGAMMAATYLAYLLLYDRLVARATGAAAPAGEAA